MPRRPRSYIEPGVGKRVTRAAAATKEGQAQPAQATALTTQATAAQPEQRVSPPPAPSAAAASSKSQTRTTKIVPPATAPTTTKHDAKDSQASQPLSQVDDERSVAEMLLVMSAGGGSLTYQASPSGPGDSLSLVAPGTTAVAVAVLSGESKSAAGKRKRSATTASSTEESSPEPGINNGNGNNNVGNPESVALGNTTKSRSHRKQKRQRTLTPAIGSTIAPEAISSTHDNSDNDGSSSSSRNSSNSISNTAKLKLVDGASSNTVDISQPDINKPGNPKTVKAAPRRMKRGKTVETIPVFDVRSEKVEDDNAYLSRQKRSRALVDKFFPVLPPVNTKRAVEQERAMSPTKRFKTAHLAAMEADFNHYSLPSVELLISAAIRTYVPENVYFFAYDHLMREDFMLREYPDAVPMGVAKIEGWRFCLAGPRREGIDRPGEGQLSSEGYPTIVSCQPEDGMTTPVIDAGVTTEQGDDRSDVPTLGVNGSPSSQSSSSSANLFAMTLSGNDKKPSYTTSPEEHTAGAKSPEPGNHVRPEPSQSNTEKNDMTTALPTPCVYGRLYLLPYDTYHKLVSGHLATRHAAMALTLHDEVELLAPIGYDSHGNETHDVVGLATVSDPQFAHLSLPLRTIEVLAGGQVQTLYVPPEAYHVPSRCASQAAMAAGYDVMMMESNHGYNDSGVGDRQVACADVHWQSLLIRDHERDLLRPVLRADEQSRWAANGLAPKPKVNAGQMLVDLRPRLEATRRIFGDGACLDAARKRMRLNGRIAEHEAQMIAQQRQWDRAIKVQKIRPRGGGSGKGKKSKNKAVTQRGGRVFVNGDIGSKFAREMAEIERELVLLEKESKAYSETEDLQPRLALIAPLEPRHVSPVMYGGQHPTPRYTSHTNSSSSSLSSSFSQTSSSNEDDNNNNEQQDEASTKDTPSPKQPQKRQLDIITTDQQDAHAAYMQCLHDAVVDAKIEGLVPAWYIYEDLRAWVPHPRDIQL